MVVTAITPLDGRRCKVFLDEDFAFVLYRGEIRRFHLEEKGELSRELKEQILREVIGPRARERSLFLLKDRSRTSAEIRRKLREGLYPEEIIEETVAFLEEYRYLDDEEYAERYLELYGNQKSIPELRRDLMKRGLSGELIKKKLEEVSPETEEAIAAILRKKNVAPETASPEEKKKVSAYLLRRGFSWEDVRQALSAEESFFLDRTL